jgi:hypothetical protein
MAKLGAALVCLLFAIPFGGVGAGASYAVYRMVTDSHRAAEWVRVKAFVDSFSSGKVQYHYTFRDTQYRGDRLGVNPYGGTDDIDSWHDDKFAMFSHAQMRKEPITVWVNPENPAESMVDRDVRWKLVFFAMPFALGFGGVGVGAIYMFFRALLGSSQTDAGSAIRASGGGMSLAGAWIFAFFWNVISIPAAVFLVTDAIHKGEWMWLVLLILPLIGLLLLWGAITATFRAIRARFTREPELPRLVPQRRTNDGFARGMIGDAPALAGGAAIDTFDTGMPPRPDPTIAELGKVRHE